ncbi:MAG TPA: hypothetical protein VMQ62_15725 [Dongiaceae bacterium]|nr:hypothetical protein [Dongiaceae bacterium]
MPPEPVRRGRRWLAAAILLVCAPPALAKINEVRVTLAVPMKERIDVSTMRTVLVTQLIVTQETREVDLGREMVASLRRDLHHRTTLQPVGDPAPALPEQPLKELLANTGFWRRLADKYGADLVVAGETSFHTADRSGFQEVDAISPVTGQRIRRTVMVQREGFFLDLRLFFLRGSTGELLYEDHYNTETTRDGMGYDRLATLIDLYEQMSNDILAVVSPQPQTVQRTIFSE